MDVPNTIIRFGVFEVDLEAGELRKQGAKVKLQEQPFQILLALIERPGQILTREELQKRLWPAGVNVDFERGINKAVNRAREALGDDAANPRFIETLPLRGYRFLADVQVVKAETLPMAIQKSDSVIPARLLSVVPRNHLRIALAWLGALLISGAVVAGYRAIWISAPKIKSLAVLPLVNASGDLSQEYFSDGMTDELIGELAKIDSLRVISRTSSMRYKGQFKKSLPEIARELRVDVILEGTVTRTNNKVRITAQLIRAYDDRHLWSEKYESDLADVLFVQDEVAVSIAHEIQAKLSPQTKIQLARTHSVNPDAYQAFLKGNYLLYKGIPGISKSIEYFQDAIRIDAGYSEAYAGLAESLCYAGIFGLRPSAQTYPEARKAALRALELDDSNARAHNALADVKQGFDWDLQGAEAEFQRSLRKDPNHLLARLWHAECLGRMKKYDEALAESSRALELDPVSPVSLNNRSMLYFRARRYAESIRVAQQALDLDPNMINAIWWQALSYAAMGQSAEAVSRLQKATSMNDGPVFWALLGHVYGRIGDKEKALQCLGRVTTIGKTRYVSPMDFAVIYAGLGDADRTFEWLETAYRNRAIRIHELPSMYFDQFQDDTRYTDLMHRIGLS